MKYEDLSFTINNKDGVEVVCDITSVVPNDENKDEPYIVFTDYSLDDNDEFVNRYGRLIQVDDDYLIKEIFDEDVIKKINDGLKDEIVSYVNKEVQENIE